MNRAQTIIALVLGVVPKDYELYDLMNLTALPACRENGHSMMQEPEDQGQTERHYYRARCWKCQARLSISKEKEIEGSAYEDPCPKP